MLTKMLRVGSIGTSGTLKLKSCWVVGCRHNERREKARTEPMKPSTIMRPTFPGINSMQKIRMRTRQMFRMTMSKVSLKEDINDQSIV